MTVAALYVDALGPYPKLLGVDCWALPRDARSYDGPNPVVAHPPCGPWGRLRHLYRGNEHDCAPIDQCEWGHVARKRTRLYLVGVPRSALEAPPFQGRKPTHWVSGFLSTTNKRANDRNGCAVPPGIKVCSAQQRRRTPPLFAEYLVRLARAAVRP